MRTGISQAALALVLAVFVSVARPDVPDLAKLKAAAEAGDVDAELAFAQHFPIGGADWHRWLEAAVAQGDGRAEDELAWALNWSYFAVNFPNPAMRASHLKSNSARMRQALVLASSAADKGLGRSRLLLGMAFASGYLVNQDSAEAYKWLKLSQTGDIVANMTANQLRDRLLKEMPLSAVEEGDRRAAAYRPGSTANFVHAQLTLPLLKLTGLASAGGQRIAILNGAKLPAGEDTRLTVEGLSIAVHTVTVDQRAMVFCLPPDPQQYELRPGSLAVVYSR